MPFHSPDDADFWELEPEFLKPIQDLAAPRGVNILHFLLGDERDENVPVAAMLQLPPHYVLPRHAHPVTRFEVVVSGTIDVGDRVLKPGDVMVSQAGEFYGPHTAGPEGCTTVEVFSSVKGVGNTIREGADGSLNPVSLRD